MTDSCTINGVIIADLMLALSVLFAVAAVLTPAVLSMSQRARVIMWLVIAIVGISGCLWSLL